MAIDSATQRRIMGRFATGVTVVTTRWQDELVGLTANAVASLSLDPPLVLVAIDRASQTHAKLVASRCYAVNILSAEQQEISQRFAQRGPKDFTDLNVTTAVTGAPILGGVLGWVDCRVTEILPGGDHDIFIGHIEAGGWREGSPLLFFAGKYARLDVRI
ncbi:MAG: flavin reductase family protein [Pirellulales bacterium]|nr:flavin reductase family protein [Pirellulales bacterium]